MVGRFMIGFQEGVASQLYALCFALLLPPGYALMGSCWLILKCEHDLQRRAIRWARIAIWLMVLGAILTSLTAPFVNTRIYDRMLAFPEVTLLLALPLVSVMLTVIMHVLLGALPLPGDRLAWLPFALAVMIFVLGFVGLVYSFYLDHRDAADRRRRLRPGVTPADPVGHRRGDARADRLHMFAYRVFKGKAHDLSYD